MHLAISVQLIYEFWIGGSHNQMCTYKTQINVLVTNLFYIHARHHLIEAARRDKNGMLQSVPRSAGRSLSDMMSALYRAEVQTSQSDASKHVPEHSFTG